MDAKDINAINLKLPKKTSLKEDGLYREIKLANSTKFEKTAYFVPYVKNKIIVENLSNGTTEEFAEGLLIFADELKRPPERFRILTSQDMKATDWYKLSNGCIISTDCKNAEKYLMEILRFQILSVPDSIKYKITGLGWCEFEGKNYYRDGANLIGAEERNDIFFEPYLYNGENYHIFSTPEKYSEKEAVDNLWKAIRLNFEVGLIVLLYTIAGILKSFLKALGIKVEFVLYIPGPSGIHKTEFIPLICQLHNRDIEITPTTRFNSTGYSLELLINAFPDSTITFDDLFKKGADKKDYIKAVNILIEIIRIIGDDKGRLRKGVELKPLCNVIAMGEEELPANLSTSARFLSLPFTSELNRDILMEFQNKPLLISTFYANFIRYCVDNQDKIKSDTKKYFYSLRKNNNLPAHPRLRDIYNIFKICYRLLMEYIIGVYKNADANFDEKVIRGMTAQFENMLLKLIFAQQQKINDLKPVDYLELLKNLYRSSKLDISDKKHKFKDHACAISKDGYLCIRTEQLAAIIQQYAPNATHDNIMFQLKSKNVLKFETINGVKKYTPKSCKERIRAVNVNLKAL